ncbi:hypothetical protein [uncultured Paracoccus sp.]|uniref:hypothetical protein n=1 Tax=uncultured Paracoccus sp. TaxID=189685 RepID=UPI0026334689|nr:hypothetical protein [uncultured Paracoccus sp.]
MKRQTDRRRLLFAAGTAAVAVVAGSVSAQSGGVSGTVTFEGGGPIPKGQIEITLENSAVAKTAQSLAATAGVESNGKATALEFTLPAATLAKAVPTQEIVAQLLREDGWLLARGSAQIEPGAPVEITLYTVMY